MLAARRAIKLLGHEIERTPLLVPSFSSKGFPQVQKIIEYSSELIDGVTLISAYDLHHNKVSRDLSFPSLLFLDSGDTKLRGTGTCLIFRKGSIPQILGPKTSMRHSWPLGVPISPPSRLVTTIPGRGYPLSYRSREREGWRRREASIRNGYGGVRRTSLRKLPCDLDP